MLSMKADMLCHSEKGLKLPSVLCKCDPVTLQICQSSELRILRHQQLERIVV